MAGHSKWANIKHKKAATDAKRGKIFTRLIKELTVASKLGGSDPAGNPRLRMAMEKAFDNNMPKDTVQRAIKRGSGELEGVAYEEYRYEGYGVGGAAVMVDCLTDKHKRTVADVRHAFTKFGGNLGTDGSVSFLFKRCGQIIFGPEVNEEMIMDQAIDAGAEDVVASSDGSIEIISSPEDYPNVRAAMENAGFKVEYGDIIYKPTTEIFLSGEDAERMQKLLDALEDLDDVQAVYSNVVLDVGQSS